MTAMVCTVPVVSRQDEPPPRTAGELSDESARIEQVNAWRAARRGYLVFAVNPERVPDEAGYREVYATEARSSNEATAKIRAVAGGRRLTVFLATGTYKAELANARWVP
jgi:hypothetical protein